MAAVVGAIAGAAACAGAVNAFALPRTPLLTANVDAEQQAWVSAGRGRMATAATPGGAASSGRAAVAVAVFGLILAGTSRRRSHFGGRDSGRVIVRGRNYETNIRKKKGPAELKKARLTAKHLGFITLALRDGPAEESSNPGLAKAIRGALKDNVPRATIDNRIKKFVEGKEVVVELSIGGYSVGGAAVMVQCVTDNSNRLRTAIKECFKEIGGQVGNDGCVDHCFNKQGVLRFAEDEEQVIEASMEAEIEDCAPDETPGEDGNTLIKVTTLPENIHSAQDAFESQGMEPVSMDVEFAPTTQSVLNEEATYEMKRLMYLLEEVDDVQGVHHNAILKEGVELAFSQYGLPYSYARAQKGK